MTSNTVHEYLSLLAVLHCIVSCGGKGNLLVATQTTNMVHTLSLYHGSHVTALLEMVLYLTLSMRHCLISVVVVVVVGIAQVAKGNALMLSLHVVGGGAHGAHITKRGTYQLLIL